jgi:hypothetical protein
MEHNALPWHCNGARGDPAKFHPTVSKGVFGSGTVAAIHRALTGYTQHRRNSGITGDKTHDKQ